MGLRSLFGNKRRLTERLAPNHGGASLRRVAQDGRPAPTCGRLRLPCRPFARFAPYGLPPRRASTPARMRPSHSLHMNWPSTERTSGARARTGRIGRPGLIGGTVQRGEIWVAAVPEGGDRSHAPPRCRPHHPSRGGGADPPTQGGCVRVGAYGSRRRRGVGRRCLFRQPAYLASLGVPAAEPLPIQRWPEKVS